MQQLSDGLLWESYLKAKKLNLDPEFIAILEKELRERGLLLKNQQVSIS